MNAAACSSRAFGLLPSGLSATLFTLTNRRGHVVTLTDFGAAIVDLIVPDRTGTVGDVSLGFADLAGYLSPSNPFFGCVVGRFGNRIALGRFCLDGTEYRLAANNGANHLHGGVMGFDKQLWAAAVLAGGRSVRFSRRSPDGEEGYPGNLDVSVTYTWSDADELIIDYEGTTDAPTIINLTNHIYFNLAGAGTGDVAGHRIQILADRYTPVSAALIPTGEMALVAGTPMDFRVPRLIGEYLRSVGDTPKGYDHNFVLNAGQPASPALAVEVVEPACGRRLRVSTTEPGVQFYTGNFLDGAAVGKGGIAYQQYAGFCLETQHFPDSPNQPNFPSVVLRPGQIFKSTTVFAFDTV